jgi:hypothetical protein
MSTVGEKYGVGGHYRVQPGFLASLECELESVKNGGADLPGWKFVPDGSLRNGGCEYTSRAALDRAGVVATFKELHKQLIFRNKEEAFSERTSTHVHVNVSNVDEVYVRQLVLLYALFEEFFFAMVKPVRRDNIHCVPLTETYFPAHYHLNLDGLFTKWHKYTALNLKRLLDLGTVEFRHMHGTGDPAEIDTWLHVLENLWKVSQRVKVDETTLANKEQIGEWFDAIFFPADKVMMLRPSLFNIIQNSLIDVKFSTIKPQPQ